MLLSYLELRKADREFWAHRAQTKASLKDLQAVLNAITFLRERKIDTVQALGAYLSDTGKRMNNLRRFVRSKEQRIRDIDALLAADRTIHDLQPVYDEYGGIRWKSAKERFATAHADELEQYKKAQRLLHKFDLSHPIDRKPLRKEKAQLELEVEALRPDLDALQAELDELKTVRYWVRKVVPDALPSRTESGASSLRDAIDVSQKTPTWMNFGGALNQTEDVSGDAYITLSKKGKVRDSGQHFVDYEEGIYVGYRYYETAYAEAQQGNYPGFDYDKEVVYPFGYGLSYTDFQWTLENADTFAGKSLEKDEQVTFRVNVTNNGAWPARDVVELYVTLPYTKGGIEKSAKVLVGFEKTDVIAPGEHAVVEITVDPYDFSSYDYNDANHNSFKGYELEAGAYVFSVSRSAHDAVQTVEMQLADDIRYETAVNQFTDQEDPTQNADTELGSVLSRADFAGTWPQARTFEEKQADKEFVARLEDAASHPNNPNAYSILPVQGTEEITLKFGELAGAAYDDPRWEEFLNQLTVAEMVGLVNEGAFHTKEIDRLGVPRTISADGPVGFCNFMGDPTVYDTCVYPCEVTLASTWNVDLLYDMGESVGNEGLVGNVKGDGSPYTGWYAPGLNIHRSPFGGRNFEYYSEDCFLSGKMAASVTKGAASKGVYTCLKHFALNEQETHRSGTATWATEQAIREIYIKGFEHVIKAGDAKGVMSSFNRIGERWTGGDYRLLTSILRDEWGFEGLVICDFNTHTHMNVRDMVYAGGDHNLETAGFNVWKNPDATNAADVTVLRNAAKNILYVVANTNGMRSNFVMKAPVWQIAMYVIDGVLAAVLVLWGILAIKKARKPSVKKA